MKYCTTCGTLNPPEAKFCTGCGKNFQAEKTVDEAAENAAVQAQEGIADVPAADPAPENVFTAEAAAAFGGAGEAFRQEQPGADDAPSAAPEPASPSGRAIEVDEYSPYESGETAQDGVQAGDEADPQKATGYGIASFVLGICSICFSWFMLVNIFTLIAAIIGLIFSRISLKNGTRKMASAGKVLSIIGIILSALSIIIWIIIIIIAAVAMARGGMSYNDGGFIIYY